MSGMGVRELSTLSRGGPEADAANTELKSIQFRAVTAFNRLRDDVAKLGTPADTPDLRHRVSQSSARFGELAQEFKARTGSHPAKDATATQKVIRDFQGLLKSSERLMSTARDREAASLPRQPGGGTAAAAQDQLAAAARQDAERQALLDAQRKQALVVVENELVFNQAVIEERDQAIQEISGQIGEVHQIFQDLAVLVHDQGEMLGDIEANITRAADRTADAHVQVVRAERLQRRVRNTWCFLMMLAGGVLGILLLIILA